MSTLVPPLPPARIGDARGPAGLPQAFNEPCYAFVKYKHRVCAEFAKEAMANQATQRGPFSFGGLPTFPELSRTFRGNEACALLPRPCPIGGRARGASCGALHAAGLHASEWTARRTVQPFEGNTCCINVR
jgi:hypothetical protein